MTTKLANLISPTNKQAKSTHHLDNGYNNKKLKNLSKISASTQSKSFQIPRNVNFYRHLLNDSNANEHGIEWALHLRSPCSSSTMLAKGEQTSTMPFSMSDKSLECQNEKKTVLDVDPRNELHNVAHLIHGRIGPTMANGTINFETGLRSYSNSSKTLKDLEKKWSPLPKRDRAGEKVQMYPSYDETKSITKWSTKNLSIKTHSAFDSAANFPQYGLIKAASKNIAGITHLFAEKGQTVSGMNWQCSMRNYEAPRRTIKSSVSGGELGELKNVHKRAKAL